jgi:TolB protein
MERTGRPFRPRSSPRRSPLVVVLVLAAGAGALGVLRAAAQQDISQIVIGGQARPRFAVPACVPRKGDEPTVAACRTLTEILRNDLQFEGLFEFVPESIMGAIPALNPDAVNFEDWKSIGAKVLVVTRADVVPGKTDATKSKGELTVEVQVYFVDASKSMLAKRYSGPAENPRVFAHQASDDIMTLTQYKGVARTRIAFASDRDSTPDRKTKELYIVDYDGYNPRRVTVNGSLNILPNWSPDGRALAYLSYRGGTPAVYLAYIFEGRSTPNLTGEKNGSQVLGGATFSPDGKRIAFASNRSGNTEIWVANADGTGTRRLTSTRSENTAPAWSPTGQEIAFTSNRTGTPQIWVMDSEGLNVRRLSTVGNYNDAPAWNPSRQYSEVAYTSRLESGKFDIAVVDLASGQVRQVTQGRGNCEYPSWAPNGRHLVFSCSRGGRWEITQSDRDGRTVQALATGEGNNVQPDWGP